MILGQRVAFPFVQGMNNFRGRVTHILDGEGYSAFNTIEVIVQPQTLQHEEGSSDTTQPQFTAEGTEEEILDFLDSQLCLLQIQRRAVAFWFDEFTHDLSLVCRFATQRYCFSFKLTKDWSNISLFTNLHITQNL